MGLLAAMLVVGVSAVPNSNRTTVEKKNSKSSSAATQAETAKAIKAGLINLPLVFEKNQGQTDSQAQFLARGKGYTAFMIPSETVLRLKDGSVLRMKLRSANASPKLRGEDRKASVSNYYIGSDQSKWLMGVPHYGKVRYEGVYQGIDAVYSGNESQLEYDFVVKAGADPNQIRMAFEGAENLAVNQAGDLEVSMVHGKSVNHKPVVYQQIRGQRKPVDGEFVLLAKNEVGFHVGAYDRSRDLVIDPTLQVWAFIGGVMNDEGSAIAVSANGGVFITGRTQSATFPGEGGGTHSIGTNWDAFVTGLNPGLSGVPDGAGTAIVFTTFIGGTGDDAGRGIAVDNKGFVYVAGYTSSFNFPATLGNGATVKGPYDAFIAKLTTAGSGLTATTYGGNGLDQALSIALDYSTANATATATITNGVVSAIAIGSGGSFYVSTPHVTIVGGGGAGAAATATITNGAVSAITITNGGAGYVTAPVVTIDTPGLLNGSPANPSINPNITPNIVIGGRTSGFAGQPDLPAPLATDCQQDHQQCGNNNLPVRYRGGDTDGFIAKFKNDLTPIVATYLGSSDTDQVNGVAVDLTGNIYATGFTIVNPRPNQQQPDGVTIPNPYPFPVVNGLTMDSNCGQPGSSGPVLNDNGSLTQPIQPNAGCRDAVPGVDRRRVAFVAKFAGAGGAGTSKDLNFLANSALFGTGSMLGTRDEALGCDTNNGDSIHCDAGLGIAVDQNFVPDTVTPPIFGENGNGPDAATRAAAVRDGDVPERSEPGVAGPRVYVVGTTSSPRFGDTILSASCIDHSAGISCPTPNVEGIQIANNRGQTQGWLATFQFPTATYPFNPTTIPNYIVFQPPTCNGQGGCQQGSNVGVTANSPLGAGAPFGSWNGVAVDQGQQAYVIGQMGMSPNCISAASTGCTTAAQITANSGEFGTGAPTHVALEIERIDPNGNPEFIFGNPRGTFPCDLTGVNGPVCVAPSVTTPSSSFVIDTGLGVQGSNYGQFDGPPPPNPNEPSGIGNGIAVNGLREAFFVGTSTAFVPPAGAGVRACGASGATAGTLCGPAPLTGGFITNAPIAVSNTAGACTAGNTGSCQGSGYGTTAPACTIAGAPAGGVTCSTTVVGGSVTTINFQNTGATSFSSPPTITIAAPPAASTSSGGFGLVTTPRIDPVNPPVPKTQANLGTGVGTANASVPPALEDVLYGAIQFYDAEAVPNVLNFSGTVRAPAQTFDFPIPPPQTVLFYNWQGEVLTIPPGCSITDIDPVNNILPNGNRIFTISQVSNTAAWTVTTRPEAMNFPGVRTVVFNFTFSGPCSGVPGVPLDAMDSITATLTVFAPLNLSPQASALALANITTDVGSGVLRPLCDSTPGTPTAQQCGPNGMGLQLFPNASVDAVVDVFTTIGRVDFTAEIIPLANTSTPPLTSGVSPNWPTLTAFGCSPVFLPGDADGDGPDNFGTDGPLTHTAHAALAGAAHVHVTVNASCIARLPVGIYSAAIVFTNTPNTPGLPGIVTQTIPISINVGNAALANTPETIVLGDSKVPQQTALPVSFPLGPNPGPFNYTVGYVPNNTVGTALPPQYVSIVSGGTGTVQNGGQVQVVVQVNPCPGGGFPCLPIGVYSGVLLASGNGQASGATPQTTVPLIVFIGGQALTDPGGTGPGFGLMQPPNSPPIGNGVFPPTGTVAANTAGGYPLTISIPAGFRPSDTGGQLPNNTIIQITGLANTRNTPYQPQSPTVDTFTPALPAGTITFDGPFCTSANGATTFAVQTTLPSSDTGPTCFYSMEVDSTLLQSGTAYKGSITFAATPGTIQVRPLTVPLTLNVTAFPQLTVTQPVFVPNPTPQGAQLSVRGVPLPTITTAGGTFPNSLVLTGTIGNSTPSCQVIDISTSGGFINGVSIAPITVPWLSVKVPPAQFQPPAVSGVPGVFTVFGVLPPNAIPAVGQPLPATGNFAAGPTTVGVGLQTLDVCVDPSRLNALPAPFALTFNGGPLPVTVNVLFNPVIGGPIVSPVAKFSQLGVFRPPTPVGGALGFFALDVDGNNAFDAADKFRQFGLAGDIPVAGDWDGTGVVRLGVFRCPAVGVCGWYLDNNNNGTWDGTFGGDVFFQFGLAGDKPVVGDWNGNGISKVGVMRCPAVGQPGTCTWYLDVANVRTPNDPSFLIRSYGIAGDQPAVGNWSGVVVGNAPVDSIGVFRCPAAGVCAWIVDSNGNGSFDLNELTNAFMFGLPGDLAVVGNWNGNGQKRIGVFRSGTWILDINGNGTFDVTDLTAAFGLPGDLPVVGFWTLP